MVSGMKTYLLVGILLLLLLIVFVSYGDIMHLVHTG